MAGLEQKEQRKVWRVKPAKAESTAWMDTPSASRNLFASHIVMLYASSLLSSCSASAVWSPSGSFLSRSPRLKSRTLQKLLSTFMKTFRRKIPDSWKKTLLVYLNSPVCLFQCISLITCCKLLSLWAIPIFKCNKYLVGKNIIKISGHIMQRDKLCFNLALDIFYKSYNHSNLVWY